MSRWLPRLTAGVGQKSQGRSTTIASSSLRWEVPARLLRLVGIGEHHFSRPLEHLITSCYQHYWRFSWHENKTFWFWFSRCLKNFACSKKSVAVRNSEFKKIQKGHRKMILAFGVWFPSPKDFKSQWWRYCDSFGNAVRDPGKAQKKRVVLGLGIQLRERCLCDISKFKCIEWSCFWDYEVGIFQSTKRQFFFHGFSPTIRSYSLVEVHLKSAQAVKNGDSSRPF